MNKVKQPKDLICKYLRAIAYLSDIQEMKKEPQPVNTRNGRKTLTLGVQMRCEGTLELLSELCRVMAF